MDKDIAEGQQQNDNSCSAYGMPSDDKMATCSKCNKHFHISCVNIRDNTPFLCPQCLTSPANSIISHRSVRSQQSQSHNVQLQLQRLEEERALNKKQTRLHREYLNKKYQLLQEADDISNASSNKSQSIQDWVNEMQFQKQPVENCVETPQRTTNTFRQETNMPNQTSYLDIPINIASRISNQIPQSSDLYHSRAVPNDPCSTVTTTAPICALVIATSSGNQRRAFYSCTQTATHPPAVVTFSDIPYYNTSIPPPTFNSNATFNGNSPIEQ